jgi:predicted metalloprotease with PDZ domain
MHELVHVFSRIQHRDRSDWVTEGLAEYYAIELLRRAGGLSEVRYQKVREQLTDWSKSVKSLRGNRINGAATARAVLLLQELDREIRQKTKATEPRSLDDVTRGLMRLDKVSTNDLIELSERVMGTPSEVLDSKLLK